MADIDWEADRRILQEKHYDPWAADHVIIPMLVCFYGVPWYIPVLGCYAWKGYESAANNIMLAGVDALLVDPLLALVGAIFGTLLYRHHVKTTPKCKTWGAYVVYYGILPYLYPPWTFLIRFVSFYPYAKHWEMDAYLYIIYVWVILVCRKPVIKRLFGQEIDVCNGVKLGIWATSVMVLYNLLLFRWTKEVWNSFFMTLIYFGVVIGMTFLYVYKESVCRLPMYKEVKDGKRIYMGIVLATCIVMGIAVWGVSGGKPSSELHMDEMISHWNKEKPKQVILVGIDGIGSHNIWRPIVNDVLPPSVPYLEEMISVGAWTDRAQIVTPVLSGPNWASILTGELPSVHGVMDNHMYRNDSVPTLFDSLGYGGALDDGWSVLTRFLKTNTTGSIVSNLHKKCLFIYFGKTDTYGHKYGGYSQEYKEMIEYADEFVLGPVWEYAKNRTDTVVIVTSDHGHVMYKTDAWKQHSDESYPVPLVMAGGPILPGTFRDTIYTRMITPFIKNIFS